MQDEVRETLVPEVQDEVRETLVPEMQDEVRKTLVPGVPGGSGQRMTAVETQEQEEIYEWQEEDSALGVMNDRLWNPELYEDSAKEIHNLEERIETAGRTGERQPAWQKQLSLEDMIAQSDIKKLSVQSGTEEGEVLSRTEELKVQSGEEEQETQSGLEEWDEQSGLDELKAQQTAELKRLKENSQNLWKQEDVPHSGWNCVGVEDLGAPVGICEMCGYQIIRYAHHMEHPRYRSLSVGCVCAGRMEGDVAEAKRREADLDRKSVV